MGDYPGVWSVLLVPMLHVSDVPVWILDTKSDYYWLSSSVTTNKCWHKI